MGASKRSLTAAPLRRSAHRYASSLREQLEQQGGGWVTVAPRDTSQQGNDSESAALSSISRRNAEIWGQRSGCVGYETGGAQYQAGLIRGFDPAAILRIGPLLETAHASLEGARLRMPSTLR